MLVAALGVTLVGFVLLVIALVMSSVPFAWACIVICLVGFGLLIADVLGVRKGSKGPADNPAAPAPAVEPEAMSAEAMSAEATEAFASDVAEPVTAQEADVESVEDVVAQESDKDR